MTEPVIYQIEIVNFEGRIYDTLESYTIPFTVGQKIEFTLTTGNMFDKSRDFQTLFVDKITHYIERTEENIKVNCKYKVSVYVNNFN